MLILMPVIPDAGDLGENRDAALTFQIVRVHDALRHFLIRPEDAALLQHGVHQGGLAMIDVGDDGDIAGLSGMVLV